MFKEIRSIYRDLNKIKKNKIPAVIYGKNMKNINIYINNNININYIKYKIFYKNKIYISILKDIQFNPVNNKIIHIDFYKINKTINIVKIPIKIINKKKNNYTLYINKISLICNIKIPREIKIDLSKYKKYKNIKVNQIKIPKNTNLLKQTFEEDPIIISIY